MSDDNWLARQYERTGAEVAKWPAYMREMLDEERGKRTVSEQVRECPCCPTGRGGSRHGYDGGHLAYWVECSICGLSTRHYETPAAAIAAWNQRAAPKPAPEALHGYWQVEPIEEQPPTITTTYCQGCQEKETELAALRQEKDEAIGAALQVEQKCYDQAQEIKTLRETIAARERNLEFRANLITEQRNELIKAEAELAPLRALREAAQYVCDCWQIDSDNEHAVVPFGPASMLQDMLAAWDGGSVCMGQDIGGRG